MFSAQLTVDCNCKGSRERGWGLILQCMKSVCAFGVWGPCHWQPADFIWGMILHFSPSLRHKLSKPRQINHCMRNGSHRFMLRANSKANHSESTGQAQLWGSILISNPASSLKTSSHFQPLADIVVFPGFF